MPLKLPTSRAEIDAIQRTRKRIAVERARAAPFYRGKLDHIDLAKLDDPAEWAKIPILDKDMLRALADRDFYTQFCVPGPIAEYWRSGGTTGVPLFYPRSPEDIAYALVGFARVFQCAGCVPDQKAHLSFPLGIHPVGQMLARAAQREGIAVNWAGSGTSTPSPLQIELIQRLEPEIWLGMSSYGLHLANLAELRGIDLARGSVRKILCSAEPLSDAKRAKIARAWGAEVFDTFGMTEAGMMGAEASARDGFHVWTDLYAIEVVDQATGQQVPEGTVGSLVVTPLWTNTITPFLRWSSGDLVSYRAEGRSDGPFSVFPVVKHAHRTTGFFKLRGVNLNHAELEDFMFADALVSDFKAELLTVRDLDCLRLSIEVKPGADTGGVAAQLAATMRDRLEVTPEVVVLDSGTLAKEFESGVKAPRFVDRRS
jgi:phenylacetate-CoA ligase